MSHGASDTVLPIDPCGHTIARQLHAAGDALIYREFEGGHAIPPEVAEEAVGWYTDGPRG